MMIAGQHAGLLDAEPEAGVVPVIIGDVRAGTPAEEAGLKPGDRLVSLNGEQPRNSQHVSALVQQFKSAPINITVEREGRMVNTTATVRKLDDGTERLGFGFARTQMAMEPATVGTAVSYAFSSNIENLQATGAVFGQVFSGTRSVKDSGLGAR